MDLAISCRNRYNTTIKTTGQVSMGSIEVITAMQRKRRWSAEENKALVLEAEQPGMSISPGLRGSLVFNYAALPAMTGCIF